MARGTVEGTSANDSIDIRYRGDPDGDRVDNNDATLPGAGPNDDLIYAYGGDDDVSSGRGNDEVYGGDGNDGIEGSVGTDTLFGGDGNDEVYGDADEDSLFGGAGNDRLYGGDDDDWVDAGIGNDTAHGDDGDDSIDGGSGDDTLYGGDGDDEIDGGSGDDVVYGGDGDDSIGGRSGNDTLFGDSGDDRLEGGSGQDVLYGGTGEDRLEGDSGADILYGGGGEDRLEGGTGNDTLYGGDGDDRIFGGTGDDVIVGGAGADVMRGGDDRDLFVGGTTGDFVDGGAGGDDFDTLDLSGSGVDFVSYTNPNREDGIVTFLDGTTMTFQEIENVIPCFTPGTLIATASGERPVESLCVGDRVITRDNGIQELRWIGAKMMGGQALSASRHLKPVLIRAGALGRGLPERDMLVSPNHRILMSGDRTQLYFEESEVLVAAKHLTDLPGIGPADAGSVRYIHFMFDRHEVVLSNGAWTESFQPGDWSLKGIGGAQRSEIVELFPELATRAGLEAYPAARRSLKKHEARLLMP